METKLKATTQKSYYGKAVIVDDGDGEKKLRSYETVVCKIDKDGNFVRLWGGYSVTTMKHVNDFRRLYGLSALSKKEWEALPCDNEKRYTIVVNYGFFTHKTSLVFDNEDAACDYAAKLCRETRAVYADVVNL